MISTSSTYGGHEKCIRNFGCKIMKARDYLEDLGVDETVI
jgi:hypothetical protein